MVCIFFNLTFQQIVRTGLSTSLISLTIIGLWVALWRHTPIEKIKASWLCCTACAIYLVWGWFAPSVPSSDFKTFFELVKNFAQAPSPAILHETKSIPTTLYQSTFLNLNNSLKMAQLSACLAWALGAYLCHKSLSHFGISTRVRNFWLLLFCLSPGIIAYAPVISSESMFFLLMSCGLYCLSLFHSRGHRKALATCSLLIGLMFITRSNAVVFFISLFMYWGITKENNISKNFINLSIIVLPFSLILILQGSLSLSQGEGFRVSASKWGAYNLMVCTIRETKGSYSQKDLELAGFIGANQVDHNAASEKAKSIALERIMVSPIDFLCFSATDKMLRLWESGWELDYSIGRSKAKKILSENNLWLPLRCLLMANLTAALVLFTLQLVYNTRSNLSANIIFLPILGLISLNIFIEVQGRYQLPSLPLVYLAAALSISKFIAPKPSILNKDF